MITASILVMVWCAGFFAGVGFVLGLEKLK